MEKEIQLKNNGFFQLLISFVLLFAPLCALYYREIWIIPFYVIISILGVIWMTGLFIVQPNQTKVLVFFGKYCGTVKGNGFFWPNPFYANP
jgi:hypothetical protein